MLRSICCWMLALTVLLPLLPRTASAADPGDLIITEIMFDPLQVDDALGEWFEVTNVSLNAIDLDGWQFQDNLNFESFTVTGSVVVAPGGTAVLGVEDDTGLNGGVTLDYEYPTTFVLASTIDQIIAVDDGAVLIDAVAYDPGNNDWVPAVEGASLALNPDLYDDVDNNDGANWCLTHANWTYGDGDRGSPGAVNPGLFTRLLLTDECSLIYLVVS